MRGECLVLRFKHMNSKYTSLIISAIHFFVVVQIGFDLEKKRRELIEYADEYASQGRDPFNLFANEFAYLFLFFALLSLLHSRYLSRKHTRKEVTPYATFVHVFILIFPFFIVLVYDFITRIHS